MEPLISIRGVNHYYGTGQLRKQILFGITAEVFPGEIIINTGPSGSGKTTLLTLMGGLRSVEEGSLKILGYELNSASLGTLVKVRRNIGFIFQAHNLLESLSACQNVQMGLGDTKLTRREIRERCVRILQAVGLGDRVDYMPNHLSGGQKQRVAIARALVREPKVVLADEPTAALDKKTGREVVELLHNLAKKQGCAIVMVTHDNRILDIADRIVTLEDGRISSFTSGITSNTGLMLSAFSEVHRRGELLRHVATLTGEKFTEFLQQVTTEFEGLLKTLQFANQEALDALLFEILEAVTVKIRDLLEADRATLYLVDVEHGELRSKVAHGLGAKPEEIRISINTGIAGLVARTGEIMNTPDAYLDPNFNPDVDQRTGYRTRSLLCMPIFDRQQKVFAVAQVLNKKTGDRFTQGDESKFKAFSHPLAIILESYVELQRGRRAASAVS